MLTVAVICPPAPLLVPGLADRLAGDVPDVVEACHAAIRSLAAVRRVVVLSTGTGPAAGILLGPGDTVSAAPFARSDVPLVDAVRLPAGRPGDVRAAVRYDGVPTAPGSAGRTPSTGTIVAAYLLTAAHTDAATYALQIDPRTPPGDAAGMVAGLVTGTDDGAQTGIVVMADGSACHGEHAPGGDDPRAAAFDRDLVGAVTSGQPDRLAEACRRLRPLASDLRATSLPALAAFAEYTRRAGPARADLLHDGAPLGVGYPVARWRWGGAATP